MYFTFIGQCIVIYSYNKNQKDALFLKFNFSKGFHMFRTDLLSIIRSFNTVIHSNSYMLVFLTVC